VFRRGTSDEPDEGIGDGNFGGDLVFGDACTEAGVRAERAGPEDGRVYRLFLGVADDAGNEAEEPFVVTVPHDRAHGAVDSGVDHEVECDAPSSCAPAPDPLCEEAGEGEIAISEGTKGAALRWFATGFDAGAVSTDDPSLCLYVNDAPAGGSLAPDKVRTKAKKGAGALAVATRGSDLDVPSLPLPNGAVLRAELHDGSGDCVSSSFDDPSVNEPGAYEAAD
jgi:hypothetical protein